MHNAPPLRVLAVMRQGHAAETMTSGADSLNGFRVSVIHGDCRSINTDLIGLHRPDLLVLDVDLADPADLARLGQIVEQNQGRMPVIATSAETSLEGIRQLMRLGVGDFVRQPINLGDVLSALEVAAGRLRQLARAPRQDGRVVSFTRSTGGAGATTLAIQAAMALNVAKRGPVCLLDLDLQFGSAAQYLNLAPKGSAADFLDIGDRLDSAYLSSLMARHQSGLDVLAAPTGFPALESLAPELMFRVLAAAAENYRFVVIDLPHAITPWVEEIIANSELVFLVMQLNVSAIQHARRLLRGAMGQGPLAEMPVRVVLNRHQPTWFGDGVRLKHAEEALGRRFDHIIGNDYKTVNTAHNSGVPLAKIAKRSRVVTGVRRMTDAALPPDDHASPARAGASAAR